jgi:hypothetical protein
MYIHIYVYIYIYILQFEGLLQPAVLSVTQGMSLQTGGGRGGVRGGGAGSGGGGVATKDEPILGVAAARLCECP